MMGSAADASARAKGDSPAQTLAQEGLRPAAGECPQSPTARLYGKRAQHPVGDRYYLCPHPGKLALSVCGDRSVLRHGGGLVHEPLPGSATRATGRAHGVMATCGKN